ncbi:uncharacterized protein B4U79_16521 [Dinothrombium tinctorium]|uniref:Uncharacterized protein n=1 Tax=Dinothrombium tinctorium TaxID=1965070 RepID=A0A3S3RMI6_9ACAR|nr:uncharacterized protein B4U79_16662 [Dinothrombium tinctorium]RWS03363.1 uncharacterized protein B4U79_16521 [Dinothrombium tinctorium]
MKSFSLSLLSGTLAATASLCGKLAVADLSVQAESVQIRPLWLGLMIACNAFMWFVFTKALSASKTALRAVATNAAANFIVSALYGRFVFNEPVNPYWYLGTVFIVLGITLFHISKD